MNLGNGASYDDKLATDRDMVRFLLNDVANPAVFTDNELDGLLAREGAVNLAAALAIEVNATNELLASKVIRTQDKSIDGAKLADAMRAHAAELRRQYDDGADGFAFDVIDFPTTRRGPELAPGYGSSPPDEPVLLPADTIYPDPDDPGILVIEEGNL